MSGKVHIKPIKKLKVFGDSFFSGTLIDSNGKKHDHKGRKIFTIPGMGVMLNLDRPADKEFYEKVSGPTLKRLFNPKNKLAYRFDIIDMNKDADDYLAKEDVKTDLKSMVMKLTELELKTIGFFFKMGSDLKIIKAGLYKKIDGDKNSREAVANFLQHVDRKLLEYVYHGLSEGDAASKKGLWKNATGLHYYEDVPIGIGEDSVVAFLKQTNDDAVLIYEVLKTNYENKYLSEKKGK
jgi:hypothetical protein